MGTHEVAAAVFEFVAFALVFGEGGAEHFDVGFGFGVVAFFGKDVGEYQDGAGQQCHDGDDDEQFDQGEPSALCVHPCLHGSDVFDDFHHGHEHGHDDAADDDGEEDDHERFEHGCQCGDGVVDFFVVDFSYFDEHFGQAAGFFTDVDHGDHHGREDVAGAQRGDDGFAFAHGVVHFHDGV